jgi:hypothetical protein
MIPVNRDSFETMLKDIQSKYEAEKDALSKEILTYRKVIRMMGNKIKLLSVLSFINVVNISI